MSRSYRAIIIFILVSIALLPASCPAYASFPFQTSWPVLADQAAVASPKPSACPPPSRSMAIDESYNGKSFGALKNEVLVVQLKEPNPSQRWQYTGQGSFTVTGDTVIQSSPTMHDFRVKVRGPGDLMFAKVDKGSGDVVERFGVHVVIREPEPKRPVMPTYPLYDFGAITMAPGLLLLWH